MSVRVTKGDVSYDPWRVDMDADEYWSAHLYGHDINLAGVSGDKLTHEQKFIFWIGYWLGWQTRGEE